MPARFDAYYTYEELTSCLHEYADAYPALVQLHSIGKSYEGRDIWVATVSNCATGSDSQKPALWVDGNIHSAELAPSMTCLYVIDWLCRHYGSDADTTYALDTRAIYICPRVNPDGAERAVARDFQIIYSSVRPYPWPDEDPAPGVVARDVDGDGRIVMMRIPDPNGGWKVNPDEPRLMVRRGPTERGGQYYRLIREGLFEGYDGLQLKVRPVTPWLDLNRNFPASWRQEADQKGAGDYPTSEPETRVVVDFFMSHRNITGAISLHTYSGAILRPYGDRPDDSFPAEDLAAYNRIGQAATEFTGYPVFSTFHETRPRPGMGSTGTFDGWLYDQHGIFGWTVDMWDPHRQAGIAERNIGNWEREHPVEDDLKLLRWSDANMNGDGYVDWYPFDHPQLGPVELGGWNKFGTFTNPPPRFLEKEAAKFPGWVLWQALISPELETYAAVAEPIGNGTWRVRFAVQNKGWLPTYVAKKALERKVVRGVRCEIELPDGAKLVQGPRRQDVGQLEGRAYTPATLPGWPGGEPTDHRAVAQWIVQAPAGSVLRLTATHARAGRTEAVLTLGE